MEKIASFQVDHMNLYPGIYVSRVDNVGGCPVTTYDLRMTRPNFEPVMTTGVAHAIEHIGATWLRNASPLAERIIYWGPMGCRTGFYFILNGDDKPEDLIPIMKDAFTFIRDYEGTIPGAAPEDCGNYSDMDLDGAKKRAAMYLQVLENCPTRYGDK